MVEKADREPSGAGGDEGKDQPGGTGSQSEVGETHKTEDLVSLDSEELDEVEE